MAISGVSPEGVTIPELGVAPLVDSETDLEDELPTPDDSPFVTCGGFAGGSIFVSGASSFCTAEQRPRPYIPVFSTPGGGRQSDPGCLSIVSYVARLLRI